MKSPMTSERIVSPEWKVLDPNFKDPKRVVKYRHTQCGNVFSGSLPGTRREERGWSLVETM